MTRTKYPVKTVRKDNPRLPNLDQYPSAGPYANVTGMRNLYWGVDAPIIRVGVYIYKVPPKVYHSV